MICSICRATLCGFEKDHGIGTSQTVANELKHTAEITDGRCKVGISDDHRLQLNGNQALMDHALTMADRNFFTMRVIPCELTMGKTPNHL